MLNSLSVLVDKQLRPWSKPLKSRLDQISSVAHSYLSQSGLIKDLESIKGEIFAPQKRLLLIASLLMVMTPVTANSGMKIRQGYTASLISPEISGSLYPLADTKRNNHQVFGFAPYWTFEKMDNIDFDTLTTLAYFDVEVSGTGDLVREGPGYKTFKSKKATELFKKAHAHGTRVVLTITQMQRYPILALLDNPDAQDNAIRQIVDEVEGRGIDGVNVDLEYSGNPGSVYRDKFSNFVEKLTAEMHDRNPNSRVTVSVYAGSVKEPKLYDVGRLAQVSDGIFMMAYDFASSNSDVAMPTAPLYGHKEGKYWYDVSTAVEDFLAYMPADKLILGVPWYGMNYPVTEPRPLAATLQGWGWRGVNQPYGMVEENINSQSSEISNFTSGWDESSQVGWKAYFSPASGVWRMVFSEDRRSLGAKFDFAKDKKLAGIGMWAIGFDSGKDELWNVIREKFGQKLADNSIKEKQIYEIN